MELITKNGQTLDTSATFDPFDISGAKNLVGIGRTDENVMNMVIDSLMKAKLEMEDSLKKARSNSFWDIGDIIVETTKKAASSAVGNLFSYSTGKFSVANAALAAGVQVVMGGIKGGLKIRDAWSERGIESTAGEKVRAFILLFIDKIDRHSNSFGRSAVLSELIQQHKTDLVMGKLENKGIKEPETPIGSTVKGFWMKSFFIIGAIVVLFALIVSAALSGAGDDSPIGGLSFLTFVIIYAIANYVVYSRDNAKVQEERGLYDVAYDAYISYRKTVEAYYENILQMVNPNGRGCKSMNIDIGRLKSYVSAMDDYEMFWLERSQLVRRK